MYKVLTPEIYLNTRKFNYGKYKNMTIPEIKEAIERDAEKERTDKDAGTDSSD